MRLFHAVSLLFFPAPTVTEQTRDQKGMPCTAGMPMPAGFREEEIGHVQAYSFGYDHDFDVIPHLASAMGGQFTTYGVPDVLKPIYGSHPAGIALLVRLRPVSGRER